jgi:hypothetical protein
VHGGPDVAVVAVPVAAVEDHHDGRAQIGDQPRQDAGHRVQRCRAQRARRRFAVEAGVSVAQELHPGDAERRGGPVQLGLADGAEVAAVRMPGGRLAGLTPRRAGHGDHGTQRGGPRDGRTAAEGLVVGMCDGDQPAIARADVAQRGSGRGGGLGHGLTLASPSDVSLAVH